ncbi:MAG: bifunctional heptose 7-phosphate kinase/heptose 1-phosphate adenyltransferase [Hamadaea sp.]|nr:bifunctional heptose 7-phosphate kinase/heptose 1-phosphate adenyltransferase [Hamadaea sp.]
MSGLVVVGDALLDRDVTGEVERFCPDGPAPVVDELATEDRPGGAALAASLAVRAHGEVLLVTAIGADAAGDRLRELLAERGVERVELPCQGGTPEKIRLRARGQTVLRLDRHSRPGLPGPLTPRAQAVLADADAIVVSDYGRGLTSLTELRRVLSVAAASRPLVWDPHPRGGSPVPGMRLVTPNESELPAGPAEANGHSGSTRLADLVRRAVATRRNWRAGGVAVTLAAEGALLVDGGETPLVVPAPLWTTADPLGAGDQFAVAAAQALATGAVTSEAVQAAVAAASAFVAGHRPGTPSAGPLGFSVASQPDGAAGDDRTAGREAAFGLARAQEIVARTRAHGGQVVATGGCFDLLHPGHVATLRAARSLGDCLIVCMNSDRSVRPLKGHGRPAVAERDRAAVVAALAYVDAVVLFDEQNPIDLLNALRPDVWVKGGDYTADALPETEHLARWGGQTVIVPYLAGHSTTGLLAAVAGRPF